MSQPSSTTRRELGRRILRALLIAPLLGYAWRWPRIANAAEDGPPAKAKVAPETVSYQDSPKNGDKCSTCAQFVPPDECKLVTGKVAPEGWCTLFVAKSS